MTRRLQAISIVLAATLAALGAAACGSSSSAKAGGTRSNDSTGGSTTVKPADPATDLTTAKSADLTSADLPGYTETPYKPSNDLPPSVKKDFANCMHLPASFLDNDTPGAQKSHSPDFDKGHAEVSSSIEIDPKQSDIDTGWNEVTEPETEGCLSKLFESALKASASDVTIQKTAVNRIQLGVGDRSVGYAFTLHAESEGVALVAYFDFDFVVRDRAGIELFVANVGQPFDRATEVTLAQTMYDRVGTKAV